MPYTTDMSSGARHAFSVTPSDTVNTPYDFRAFSCGSSGTVTLTTLGYGDQVPAADITITVSPGLVFCLAGTRIKATGTTATGIVAYL